MELTYKVRGADGKEYGPASLNQTLVWFREGRMSATSEVKRSDVDYWAAASQYEELQPTVAPEASALPAENVLAAQASATADNPDKIRQLRSAASWFYLIAALSLINSVAALTGSSWRMLFGLGITEFIDGFGEAIGKSVASAGQIVALGINVVVAGVFVLFGIFAYKRHTWAFVTGMVLFALDGLIFLLAQQWLGVALHVFVLFCLFRGLSACRELNNS